MAIQETEIDSSELFSESCPYNVYRKDRTLDGGGVMLHIHKDISHMAITELEYVSLGKSVRKQNFSLCSKLVSSTWWGFR